MFIYYFTSVSVAQNIQLQVVGLLMSNKLERIVKGAVVAVFEGTVSASACSDREKSRNISVRVGGFGVEILTRYLSTTKQDCRSLGHYVRCVSCYRSYGFNSLVDLAYFDLCILLTHVYTTIVLDII